MASPDPADPIASRFLRSTLHLVLSSRILPRPHPGRAPPLPDLAASGFLVLDILLRRPYDPRAALLERWILGYSPSPPQGRRCGEQRAHMSSQVLLRSLHLLLRLLPAYRAFRLLLDRGPPRDFALSYSLSASTGEGADGGGALRHYGFVPVETPLGQLCASVMYLPSLSRFDLVRRPFSPSTIIDVYFGRFLYSRVPLVGLAASVATLCPGTASDLTTTRDGDSRQRVLAGLPLGVGSLAASSRFPLSEGTDVFLPFATDDLDRSRDAAIGILVNMLHPEQHLRSVSETEGSSSFSCSYTVSDALEELLSYRVLRDFVLSSRRTPQI